MDRSEVGVSPHDSPDASRLVVTVHAVLTTCLLYTVAPTTSIRLRRPYQPESNFAFPSALQPWHSLAGYVDPAAQLTRNSGIFSHDQIFS